MDLITHSLTENELRVRDSRIIFTKLRTSFHDFYPNRESIFILIVNKKDSVVLP